MMPFENGPGTEKADAGDDPLYHPAQGRIIDPGHTRHQHKQRGAHRHQHVGAHTGRFALHFTLEPEDATE
ncbi:hypothetical protein D3C75_1221200 [compost metagenome]